MLLQAGSQVGRVAYGSVVHAEVIANRADDDGTGVDADPHCKFVTVCS